MSVIAVDKCGRQELNEMCRLSLWSDNLWTVILDMMN